MQEFDHRARTRDVFSRIDELAKVVQLKRLTLWIVYIVLFPTEQNGVIWIVQTFRLRDSVETPLVVKVICLIIL